MSKESDPVYGHIDHFTQSPGGGPGILRQLYYGIVSEGPMHKQATRMLIETMFLLDDPAALARSFTEPELQTVRKAVFEATLEDLAADGGPLSKADPAIHCPLVEDYHIIRLLKPPSDTAPYEELVTYAALCSALEHHREGRGYFQKALALQPDNAYIQTSLEHLTDCSSLPRFRMAFVSRCNHAWETTADVLKQYMDGKLDDTSLHANVRKAFQLWTGLRVDAVWDSTDHGTLVFSPIDWQCSLFLINMALEGGEQIVPNAIKAAWGVYIACLSMQKIANADGKVVLDSGKIRTVLEDTLEHNGVHVKLYAPVLAPYAAYPGILEDLTCEVASALETADFCIYVRSVEILSKRPRSFTGTIATLEDQLKALGYTTGHDLEEIEPLAMHRTYTRKPQDGGEARLRDDITQGDTLLMKLQEEYENHQTSAANYFMTRGVAPVFLAWPRSIMDCDDAAYTRRLLEGLELEDHGDAKVNMKVLGQASGTKYCYLDLLLWNPTYMLKAMEAYLAKIPGGDQFRIQSFYWDAYPCPVSHSHTLQHSAISMEGCPYKTAKPADKPVRRSKWVYTGTPDPPRQTPKAKKNNAAKAKRKHSKKFH